MKNNSSLLDPTFIPPVIWNREFEEQAGPNAERVTLGLCCGDAVLVRREFKTVPDQDRSFRYLERMMKTLLWIYGGNRILFAGPDGLFQTLKQYYLNTATGRFDSELVGVRMYGQALRMERVAADQIPEPSRTDRALGRHLDGCRIGFDLGGSDRKCAALIDGKIVFSEEIKWNPYFQKDPQYHYAGIRDSLNRAAAHLPRVDAIGGSAAGVYINNEVRIASLFRGISKEDFDKEIRPLFLNLKKERGGIPFEVVNDGEVTALAGSMSLNDNAVLGISMGTSMAAGYVTPEGGITPWLNELAFVPVDYAPDAPTDEWSGDRGCGVQYFSQQAVARLAPLAGVRLPSDMPFSEQLVRIQLLMGQEDPRAHQIYETIGMYFGYTLAHFAQFYEFRHLLLLGRVTSGRGGQVIIEKAEEVLHKDFPILAEKVSISMPDEKMKRHGQAVAAASLPEIGETKK